MKIDIDLSGFEEAVSKLDELGGHGHASMQSTITKTITDTRNAAVRGIQEGPASGRIYTNGGVTHQASAPGQYPMSDSGILATSVDTIFNRRGDDFEGIAGTNVRYGEYLEAGTSKMAARPWLVRSFNQVKASVLQELRAELKKRAGI